MTLVLTAAVALSGCNEFVHMGQISDREYARPVAGVTIEQMQPDGTWKRLDTTDGNGKWWIMREKLSGGGRIRLSKPGYYTRVMEENDFSQENSVLMVPAGAAEP